MGVLGLAARTAQMVVDESVGQTAQDRDAFVASLRMERDSAGRVCHTVLIS